MKKIYVNSLEPSQQQLNNLLELYQAKKYDDAEKLSVSITEEFPKHPFAWKVLAAVLKQMGKINESLIVSQKSVQLDPLDAETYNNLGVILQELGRLEEAETSYGKSVQLDPLDAEAHNNLGNVLKQLERLKEAETSYRQAITLKPEFAEAHNNLGVILQELGRLKEAETSYRKAIELKPDFAEAPSNLGIILEELGRLKEAETSYRQAITLKPDFAEAHNNLGNVLKQLERLDEAEVSLRQAIELKPDFAEAHNNLGVTLQELGRLKEAKASYGQAIALKPDHAGAHNNLGIVLQEQGRLEEAEASYRQAIILKPDFVQTIYNLSILMDYMNNFDESVLLLESVLEIDKNNYGLKAAVNLAIFKFLENSFSDSKKLLLTSQKIHEKTSFDFNNQKVYWNYLLQILSQHDNKSLTYIAPKLEKKLYVIGESHSLVSHGLHIQNSGKDFLCKSFLIQGCKQSDLGSVIKNYYKNKFESIFCSLPEPSKILLTIGEIDCRLNYGIIKHRNKYPQKKMTDLITNTIENYLNYIFKLNSSAKHDIIIQGVPCPNIGTKNIPIEKVVELIDVIREFNVVLKNKSKKMGFGFLDVHKLTDNGDGFSNSIWHLDTIHLSPEGMCEAWRVHASQ